MFLSALNRHPDIPSLNKQWIAAYNVQLSCGISRQHWSFPHTVGGLASPAFPCLATCLLFPLLSKDCTPPEGGFICLLHHR